MLERSTVHQGSGARYAWLWLTFLAWCQTVGLVVDVPPEHPALYDALKDLTAGKAATAPLWVFTYQDFTASFARHADLPGGVLLEPEPYALRHGEASHDSLYHRRSYADRKQRGRWRAQASVRRNDQHARVLKEIGGPACDERVRGEDPGPAEQVAAAGSARQRRPSPTGPSGGVCRRGNAPPTSWQCSCAGRTPPRRRPRRGSRDWHGIGSPRIDGAAAARTARLGAAPGLPRSVCWHRGAWPGGQRARARRDRL